jgi:hypothetical protein
MNHVHWRSMALAVALMAGWSQATIAGSDSAAIQRAFPNASYTAREFNIEVIRAPGPGSSQQSWTQSSAFSIGGSVSLGLAEEGPAGSGKVVQMGYSRMSPNVQAVGATQCTRGPLSAQCWLAYDWKPGVTYRLRIEREDATSGWWQASIFDTSNGSSTPFARLQTPSPSPVSLTRIATQQSTSTDDCAAIVPSEVVLGAPKSRGAKDDTDSFNVSPDSSDVLFQATCPQVVATCDSDQDCMISTNAN